MSLTFLALAEGPVSVSALVGENALFYCNGSGFTIGWIVDGLLATDINWPRNSEKYSIIIRHSTVHPHCTSNISEQWHYCPVCALSWWGDQQQCYPDCSPWWAVLDWYHRLIVLYCWYRYWSSCQCEVHSSIQCCTVGSATDGVLSGLSYIVIVMNNNTGQVIVSATTTNTNFTI